MRQQAAAPKLPEFRNSDISDASAPISRLKKVIDATFYIFPVIFLAFVLLDMSQGISQGSKDLLNWKFIGNIVFANSTHVGLTFGILMTNEAMRAWIVERYGSIPKFCVIFGTAFVAMAALIFLFIWYNLKSSDYLWVKIYFALHSVVAIQHALSQTTGIYGATVFTNLKNTANFPQFSSALRWFAIWGTICIVAINHIDTFLHIGDLTLKWQMIASVPFFVSFIYLLWRRWKVNFQMSAKEGVFSARFFLWLLYPFSFFAPISVAAVHGLEYIKVTSHMTSYKLKLLLLAPFFVYIGFGLASSSFGIFSLYFEPNSPDLPVIVPIIGAIALSGTYIHYYLDRQIFKMRNAASRKNVMPLLKDLTRLD